MTTQEIIGVLDRSGSMRGKEEDTVGGINTMINEVKKNKGEDDIVKVSLKLFDHEEILKLRSVNIDDVKDFPVSEFVPRGQTALLDALGHTLTFFMEKKLRDPSAYDTALIYVATDGLENASKQFTRTAIKDLISTAKETYKIDVLYLGANQDAILEAGNIGIAPERAINYNENEGSTQAVYRSVARVATDSRQNPDSYDRQFNMAERQASQVTT